jgi:hypothetical protein
MKILWVFPITYTQSFARVQVAGDGAVPCVTPQGSWLHRRPREARNGTDGTKIIHLLGLALAGSLAAPDNGP